MNFIRLLLPPAFASGFQWFARSIFVRHIERNQGESSVFNICKFVPRAFEKQLIKTEASKIIIYEIRNVVYQSNVRVTGYGKPQPDSNRIEPETYPYGPILST